MSDIDKLNAIRARCVELLEIASKRTLGRWNTATCSYQVQTDEKGIGRYVAEMLAFTSCDRDADATFIASCAGAAEAGWRATIAAIDHIQSGWMDCESGQDILIKQIITAWEGLV